MLQLEVQPFGGGPYLGVALNDIDADRARALKLGEESGVEIKDVSAGSPAEAAGLKNGDVLLTYNGEKILSARQLSRLVSETPSGRKVRVQYWRDGKEQTATITVANRPQPRLEVNPHFSEENAQRLRNMQQDWQRDMKQMMLDQPEPIFGWKSSVGITGESVGGQLAQYFGVKTGVLVRSVEAGSAAEKAGIKAGDVITQCGDRPVNTARDINTLRGGHAGNKTVSLTLVRNRKEMTVNLPADAQ
jgi:serine protease Do